MQALVKLIILIKLAVKQKIRILQVVKPIAFYCLYVLIPDCICQMHISCFEIPFHRCRKLEHIQNSPMGTGTATGTFPTECFVKRLS